MPENISFNQIPVDIRTPGQYIEIDNSKAVQGLPNQERRLLVLGQRLAAGTVAQAIPTRILNKDQAEEYFGRGSMLHAMLSALKEVNDTTEVWAVALDDAGAGAAASGDVAFGGAPTAAGTLNLMIAGVQVKVVVASGEASTTTATNVAAAIVAKTELPVTAQVNGVDNTKVDITARHKGVEGNNINIRVNYYQGEALPKGLTATITAMNGGTTNPDVATALAAIADDQYQSIVMPWTDAANMLALENELSDRFGPMEQQWGHAFCGYSGTHAELSTFGDARNSAHSTFVGAKNAPHPPWVWGATLAGVVEFHSAIDPARPFQTLELQNLLPPAEEDRFNRSERNLLLHDGISTFKVDPGGRVFIERVITTYQTNSFGVEDISYLDYNTVATVDYIRYAVRTRIALRFPRYKLADDDTNYAPGQAVVTPKVIRAELIGLFRELEEVALVENFDQFKNDLIVVRSNSDPNRINCVYPPDIVNQFRVFAAVEQFRL